MIASRLALVTLCAIILSPFFAKVGECQEEEKKFIQFHRPWSTNATRDVITAYKGEFITWHAAWPHMARIVLLGNHSASITFRCEVEMLSARDELHDMTFIFLRRKRDFPKWYAKLHPKYNQTRMPLRRDRTDIFANIKFGKDGGVASLVNIPSTKSLDDVHFFCKTRNRRGQMTSNAVELFDYRWRFVSGMRTVSSSKSPIDRRMGKYFPCLDPPLDTDPLIVVHYDWSLCESKSKSCRSVLDLDSGWRIQVLPNGTLYWPFVPDRVVPKLEGKSLKCSVGGQAMAQYMKLNFTPAKPQRKTPPRLIQPRENNTMHVFDSDTTRVRLPVVIGDDGEDVEVHWTRDGQTLRKEETKGECFVTSLSGVPECRGNFPQSADYSVEISEKTTSYQHRRSTRNFSRGHYNIISNEGYPKMDPQMERQLFVVDGGSVALTCRFEKPELVIPELAILGQWIDFNSQESIANSINDINNFQRKVIAPLNVTINHAMPKKGQILVYNARNLVHKSRTNNGLSSTHYVECIGYRGYYTVRHPVLIQVVPRPIISWNTTFQGDSGSITCQEQTFRCTVLNWAEINLFGIHLYLVWTFENDISEKREREVKLGAEGVGDVPLTRNASFVLEMRYPSTQVMGRWRQPQFYTSTPIEVPYTHECPSEINQRPIVYVIIAGSAVVCLIVVSAFLMTFLCLKNRRKSRTDCNTEQKKSEIKK